MDVKLGFVLMDLLISVDIISLKRNFDKTFIFYIMGFQPFPMPLDSSVVLDLKSRIWFFLDFMMYVLICFDLLNRGQFV